MVPDARTCGDARTGGEIARADHFRPNRAVDTSRSPDQESAIDPQHPPDQEPSIYCPPKVAPGVWALRLLQLVTPQPGVRVAVGPRVKGVCGRRFLAGNLLLPQRQSHALGAVELNRPRPTIRGPIGRGERCEREPGPRSGACIRAGDDVEALGVAEDGGRAGPGRFRRGADAIMRPGVPARPALRRPAPGRTPTDVRFFGISHV